MMIRPMMLGYGKATAAREREREREGEQRPKADDPIGSLFFLAFRSSRR